MAYLGDEALFYDGRDAGARSFLALLLKNALISPALATRATDLLTEFRTETQKREKESEELYASLAQKIKTRPQKVV